MPRSVPVTHQHHLTLRESYIDWIYDNLIPETPNAYTCYLMHAQSDMGYDIGHTAIGNNIQQPTILTYRFFKSAAQLC
jgi:hypothetical protein